MEANKLGRLFGAAYLGRYEASFAQKLG